MKRKEGMKEMLWKQFLHKKLEKWKFLLKKGLKKYNKLRKCI